MFTRRYAIVLRCTCTLPFGCGERTWVKEKIKIIRLSPCTVDIQTLPSISQAQVQGARIAPWPAEYFLFRKKKAQRAWHSVDRQRDRPTHGEKGSRMMTVRTLAFALFRVRVYGPLGRERYESSNDFRQPF